LSIIEETPLQAYGAALALSPAKSYMRMQYWNERLPFIKDVKGIRDKWDPCLMTIQTSRGTEKIAMSPDGKTLASFWRMGEKNAERPTARVFLWDTETGACKNNLEVPTIDLRTPLSMVFSPNSETLFTF
jgi:WD40 repeat protein